MRHELGNDTLSAEQVQKLADELSQLSKQQSKALQTAAYISMSAEEAHDYDSAVSVSPNSVSS